jgi:propanol-preferring alcohol dehydrogenase
MGANVIAIGINDKTLQVCKEQGADATFNSRTDPDYVEKIHELTGGGVHATAVYSNSPFAYAGAPKIIRLGGILMLVGIPDKSTEASVLDLVHGRYKIKSESVSIPQRMEKAIDFSVKYDIQPQVELRKLEDLNGMVNKMSAGAASKRMAVTF